jgi:hypothetical protein
MRTSRNASARPPTSSELFLKEIERFIVANDMTPTYFGARAAGDPNFVFALRGGRSPSLKMVDQILRFIADERGSGARTASFKTAPRARAAS